jgi:hypothetical protein
LFSWASKSCRVVKTLPARTNGCLDVIDVFGMKKHDRNTSGDFLLHELLLVSKSMIEKHDRSMWTRFVSEEGVKARSVLAKAQGRPHLKGKMATRMLHSKLRFFSLSYEGEGRRRKRGSKTQKKRKRNHTYFNLHIQRLKQRRENQNTNNQN